MELEALSHRGQRPCDEHHHRDEGRPDDGNHQPQWPGQSPWVRRLTSNCHTTAVIASGPDVARDGAVVDRSTLRRRSGRLECGSVNMSGISCLPRLGSLNRRLQSTQAARRVLE